MSAKRQNVVKVMFDHINKNPTLDASVVKSLRAALIGWSMPDSKFELHWGLQKYNCSWTCDNFIRCQVFATFFSLFSMLYCSSHLSRLQYALCKETLCFTCQAAICLWLEQQYALCQAATRLYYNKKSCWNCVLSSVLGSFRFVPSSSQLSHGPQDNCSMAGKWANIFGQQLQQLTLFWNDWARWNGMDSGGYKWSLWS